MKKLIKTLEGEKFSKPPIWLMRQAGRYLPEYREIRSKADNFLNLCYNPKLASEITLQPIRRFGFDGAILFSDILVIPDALGVKVEFLKNEGPKLEKTIDEKSLLNLKINNVENYLGRVFETISLVKSQLDQNTTLIGFSGSPWTIATYMIEGGGSKNFENVRTLAISNPKFFQNLIDILVESISIYLIKQIEAGVEIIKLFDSWAGVLPEDQFQKWVIKPNQKIIENVRKNYPQFPVILFTRGAGALYENVAMETKNIALAIDQILPKKWAKEILQQKHGKIIQGNLDNILLASGSEEEIEKEVSEILNHFGDKPFIFNLGHGVLPHTPIKNIEKILKILK
ncbi:MAG: hemE [Rickettsiaceae bacterium]|jgi:uroporphyrinogen decarboxylase|nr:hemE [Rickettsiaceae bacterium]